MHVGQAVVAALEAEGQAFVIEAKAMQQRGVQVMDVDRIAGDVVAEVVGLAESLATADAAAGEPHAEAARVVIAAEVGGGQFALAVGRAAELAAPDDQRFIQ